MEKKNIFQVILVVIFTSLIVIGGFYFVNGLFTKKELPNIISTSGRIEGDEYNASSKINAKVEKIMVQEGDTVKKGQIIAELSSKQTQMQLESAYKDISLWESRFRQAQTALTQTKTYSSANIAQAKANLQKAQANFNYNEKEYGRYKNLYKEDAVPKTKFDAVQTQYYSAKQEYAFAKKELEKMLASSDDIDQRVQDVKVSQVMIAKANDAYKSAQADIEDTKIYAPANGIIASKIVEEGEVISTGTPVVTIINPDKLYLRIFLPTDKAGKLKIGSPAEIVADAFPYEKFKGYVYKISQKAEFTPKNVETKEQRSKLVFEVKVKIENNKERKLKAGMPAEAKIYLEG